jgi:hypothetical protein
MGPRTRGRVLARVTGYSGNSLSLIISLSYVAACREPNYTHCGCPYLERFLGPSLSQHPHPNTTGSHLSSRDKDQDARSRKQPDPRISSPLGDSRGDSPSTSNTQTLALVAGGGGSGPRQGRNRPLALLPPSLCSLPLLQGSWFVIGEQLPLRSLVRPVSGGHMSNPAVHGRNCVPLLDFRQSYGRRCGGNLSGERPSKGVATRVGLPCRAPQPSSGTPVQLPGVQPPVTPDARSKLAGWR